jgi:hypothetical protein
VPQPDLTPQESRLAAFCRFFGIVYFAGAACFALFPGPSYRLAALDTDLPSLSNDAGFWSVLAAAMMAACATACLVTAARPRERRHAILPVLAAKLTSTVLAAAHLLGPGRVRALLAVIATDLPLFLITLAVYRSAAPGVRSEPARDPAPPLEEPPAKIQLRVSGRD